jgi:membrane protein YdbS with pleckstrin-like domain
MNGNVEVRKRRIAQMWRDLTTDPAWKYKELPPLLLAEVTKLDLFEIGDTELARAHWFWSRRPKLSLHDSTALLVMGLCAIVSLAIAFVAWPGTSITKRNDEMVILLFEVIVEIYLIVQRLKFLRWRADYELSIDRLIRTMHPEV